MFELGECGICLFQIQYGGNNMTLLIEYAVVGEDLDIRSMGLKKITTRGVGENICLGYRIEQPGSKFQKNKEWLV